MTTVGNFRLPYEPKASKNKMHGFNPKTGRKFLHPKARAWRKNIADQIKLWIQNNDITPPATGHPVSVSLIAHFPPQGGRRGHRSDATNFVDLTIDGVKMGLGIDDYSFSVSAQPGPTDPNGGYITCLVEL